MGPVAPRLINFLRYAPCQSCGQAIRLFDAMAALLTEAWGLIASAGCTERGQLLPTRQPQEVHGPLRRLVGTDETDSASSMAFGIDGTRVLRVNSGACRRRTYRDQRV